MLTLVSASGEVTQGPGPVFACHQPWRAFRTPWAYMGH